MNNHSVVALKRLAVTAEISGRIIESTKKSRLRSFASYPKGFSISCPMAAKPMMMYEVSCDGSALTLAYQD